MTDLRVQRRIAARVIGCGQNRVWIDPLHAEDVAQAVTREDVRRLVRKGFITTHQKKGVSRGRARHHAAQKAKGRRRGPGSREGASGGRTPSKRAWINRIRALRDELVVLRDAGTLTPAQYRRYYRRAKGGVYTSRAHLVSHLVIDGVVPEGTRASTARKEVS